MTHDTGARARIEAGLGYVFKSVALLDQALTHRSLVDWHTPERVRQRRGSRQESQPGLASNEPLEFLGDAVLSFVIADLIHKRDPTGAEGPKTRMRARLVSTPTLVSIARDLDIRSVIRMSAPEEKNNGRERERVQEDAVEAIIAAVYLDGGIEAARGVISRLFVPRFAEASRAPMEAKGALQEFLFVHGLDPPKYEMDAPDGPTHRLVHRVRCVVAEEVLGRGEGSSRKKAELIAAQQALDELTKRASS